MQIDHVKTAPSLWCIHWTTILLWLWLQFDLTVTNCVYHDPLVTILDDFLVKGLSTEEGVVLASCKVMGSQFYEDLLNGGVDLMLLSDELMAIIKTFAKNENKLYKNFKDAWTNMMMADRFLNNKENACTDITTSTK